MYIIVIVDQFSTLVECVALPSQSAELVAKTIFKYCVVAFGCPLAIYTNVGRIRMAIYVKGSVTFYKLEQHEQHRISLIVQRTSTAL